MSKPETKGFNPARLRLARRRRSLTKIALGEHVGLSSRRVAAYENEGVAPPAETVGLIAEKLEFPRSFFFRQSPPELSEGNVSFRSYSRLAARRRDAAVASAVLGVELAAWLEANFELPRPDVTDLRNLEPRIAAAALRAAWGLGDDPAPNLIHLLEVRGVRVFSTPVDCSELDAFSFWYEGVPFVFLAFGKSSERARWDAAHELGHLVLHTGFRPQGRVQENEADQFAAAFLLPSRGVLAEAPRSPSLIDVQHHKQIWRVSALSYIRRLHDLRALTDWQYRSLAVEASQAGYRRQESDIPFETSQLIAKTVDLLTADGLGLRELASELDLPTQELHGLLFGMPLLALHGGADTSDDSGGSPRLRMVR